MSKFEVEPRETPTPIQNAGFWIKFAGVVTVAVAETIEAKTIAEEEGHMIMKNLSLFISDPDRSPLLNIQLFGAIVRQYPQPLIASLVGMGIIATGYAVGQIPQEEIVHAWQKITQGAGASREQVTQSLSLIRRRAGFALDRHMDYLDRHVLTLDHGDEKKWDRGPNNPPPFTDQS